MILEETITYSLYNPHFIYFRKLKHTYSYIYILYIHYERAVFRHVTGHNHHGCCDQLLWRTSDVPRLRLLLPAQIFQQKPYPKALRTHIFMFLGLKTIFSRAFGLCNVT